MHDHIRLLVGLSLSLVVHLALFWGPVVWQGISGGGGKEGGESGGPQIEAQQGAPSKDPALPLAETGETVKPLRISVNAPELLEGEGMPPPGGEESRQPESAEAAAAARAAIEKETAELQGVKREETVVEAAFSRGVERQPQDRSREAKEAPAIAPKTLTEAVEKVSREHKRVLSSAMTSSDYRRYLESLKIGRAAGKPTPQLIHAYADIQEIFAIHKFYGLKVVALDPEAPREVVELTGLGSDSIGFQKISNFNWENYGNRVFPRTEPFFERYRSGILKQKLLSGERVRLVSIVPSSPHNYFIFKQREVLARNGLSPEEVLNTVGSFHRTSFGGYIMAIKWVELKGRKVREVDDFELRKFGG